MSRAENDPPMPPRVGPLRRVGQELVAFKNGLSCSGGDMGSLGQLFFDNLSTLLGGIFAIQNMTSFGVSREVIDNTIFGKIVPGVGITLAAGNIYYSWQAIRLTNYHGRQYTAQPYGLNTPALFAFIFNIMYAVFFQTVDFDAGNQDQAFLTGYQVANAANFITGLLSVFFGCFGPMILKVVPPAALLVPIAGIGFSFLGLEQLTYSIAAPIVGYSTIIWVYLGWYSGIKIGYGNYRIPEAVTVILVGVILGWATGLNKPAEVSAAVKLVKWSPPSWGADELFANFTEVKSYLGIVIPIAIAAAASTLMCLVSAKEAGDPFPVRETMISDGIGTMIASFFGSPFGTVIYVGHPAHKRSGATVGYSCYNGIIYLIFSWVGLLALMQSLVNQATVGPIVFFVGLMINEEALNFLPSRHYSAYIIGLFPSIYDWVVNVSSRSPLEDTAANGESYNSEYPNGSGGFVGVLAWKRGSLLVSMMWVAIAVMVLDRKWNLATIWALISAALAATGIIHMPTAGFKTFSEPVWEQCEGVDEVDGVFQSVKCWQYGEQWMFFVAYLMLAGYFAIIELAKRFDPTVKEPIEDESAHAFDDWFKDAAKGAELHSIEDDLEKPELGLVEKDSDEEEYIEKDDKE